MDLNALQDFVLVATHGGFAPASRAKGIPKSSLSRRVRELEAARGAGAARPLASPVHRPGSLLERSGQSPPLVCHRVSLSMEPRLIVFVGAVIALAASSNGRPVPRVNPVIH